jgi:hypothetical protein
MKRAFLIMAVVLAETIRADEFNLFGGFDIRIKPATWNFPLGGGYRESDDDFRTYILGGAFDFLEAERNGWRFSPSIGLFGAGYNWKKLAGAADSPGEVFNVGSIDLMMHVRFPKGLFDTSWFIPGFQFGYSVLLKGEDEVNRSRSAQGFQFGFSLSIWGMQRGIYAPEI